MKVYIVADGNYSDYSIRAICSTLRKANKAKRYYAADRDIVERELDEFPDNPGGLYLWRVWMDIDGNCPRNPRRDNNDSAYLGKAGWKPSSGERIVNFEVWARDGQHAVKIAGEKRAQLIAANLWTTDIQEFERMKHKGLIDDSD